MEVLAQGVPPALNISRFNDHVLNLLGEEKAVAYKLEYSQKPSYYKLITPQKPKGDRRTIGQLNEFLTSLTLEQKPTDDLLSVLMSEDPLSLMNTGVLLRGKGHLAMAKAWYLFSQNDNPDREAFATQFAQMFGLDLPSDSFLKKALVVWRRYVVEAEAKGIEVDYEQLTKCSVYKLYMVHSALDRFDRDELLADVQSQMKESELVDKYIRGDPRHNVQVWKTFRMPETDYAIFERLQAKMSAAVGETGEHKITPMQLMTSVLRFTEEIADDPQLAVRLWNLTQGSQDVADTPPRLEDGSLDMAGIGETFTHYEIRRMVEQGTITKDDVMAHPEAFEEIMRAGQRELPPVETDLEVEAALAVAEKTKR